MKNSLFYRSFDKLYYSSDAYQDYPSVSFEDSKTLSHKLFHACQLSANSLVVDIGCGFGSLVQIFTKLGTQAIGTEVSDHAFTQKNTEVTIIGADAHQTPFKSGTFDLVTCIQVLYYYDISSQLHILSELCRISKRFIYLDTISKGTVNASQKSNPDRLRNSHHLLPVQDMNHLTRLVGLELINPIEPYSINPDFHGLFRITG
jgi:SAM-dependent methyltransferase